MSPRGDRRAAVGVELMEARVSLSNFTVTQPGLIRAFHAPDMLSPDVVRTSHQAAVVHSFHDPDM
jgi:hypothetical protein